MKRRLLVAAAGLGLLGLLGGAGYYVWSSLTEGEPPPPPRVFTDTGGTLPTQAQFDALAETDPVGMLAACLTRYQREVKGGMYGVIEKQERVYGKPAPDVPPPVEIISVWVRGDVPDPETQKTAIEVRMKWTQGAKKLFGMGAEVTGTLFSEKTKAEGGYDGKMVAWRPEARAITGGPLSSPTAPNNDLAKSQSRYCIRDAGLYPSMFRTHAAWKARQEAGELKFKYLDKKTLPQIGRACHVIKRLCQQTEVDAFEFGKPADPKADGFTEVTIYIDAERWLQLGTELYRTDGGTRVLVGAYYFRDVELNPNFPADTFTEAGLKK